MSIKFKLPPYNPKYDPTNCLPEYIAEFSDLYNNGICETWAIGFMRVPVQGETVILEGHSPVFTVRHVEHTFGYKNAHTHVTVILQ